MRGPTSIASAFFPVAVFLLRLLSRFVFLTIFLLFYLLLCSTSGWGQTGVTITSPEGPVATQANPIPLNFDFDQPIKGFELSDITVTGGTVSAFQAAVPDYSFVPGKTINVDGFHVGFLDISNIEAKTNKVVISIASNSLGEIFVLTFGNGILKYDLNGNRSVFNDGDELESPLDLAINSEGKVYVADNGQARQIKVFAPDGTFLEDETIGDGTAGSAEGKFYGPVGLTFDHEDNLYVADAYTGDMAASQPYSVRIFYKDGNYTRLIGDSGVNLENPFRVAVDAEKNIYVSDSGGENGRVVVFNSNLKYIETIGGGADHLGAPGSIVIDDNGYIYIADFGEDVKLSDLLLAEEDPMQLLEVFPVFLEGIENNVFDVTVFDRDRNFVKEIRSEIDLPVDLTLNRCGYLAVNNVFLEGEIWGIIPDVDFDFDIDFFNILPDKFSASLSLTEQCTQATVSVASGAGVNADCASIPSGASDPFSIIWDTEAPIINCPGEPYELQANEEGQFILPDFRDATDNCEGDLEIIQNPPSGVISADTDVSITAVDAAGNTAAACEFRVILEQGEAPAFSCPTPEELPELAFDEDCKYSVPKYDYLLDSFQNFQNEAYFDQSQVRDGLQLLVEIDVYDGEGGPLVKTCRFNIQLVDQTAPTIDCPSSPQSISANEEGEYLLPDYGGMASDNCNPSLTIVQNPSPGPITSDTDVSIYAVDAAGNTSAVCEFRVVLVIEEVPSFSCPAPGDLPQLQLDEDCSYTAPDYEYLLDSFENFENDPFFEQSEERNGNLLEVKIDVYDGEGGDFVNSCEFNIQLVDQIDPRIDCPTSPQSISANEDGEYFLPDYRGLAKDNCDENLVVVQDPPAGIITENTSVTITATDAAGNVSSQCSFKVVLVEEGSPSFLCPEPGDLPTLEVGLYCEIVIRDYSDLLRDFQNFQNIPHFVQTEERAEQVLEVRIEVFDGEGGESAGVCNFQIPLVDSFPPQINCPTGSIDISANAEGKYILPDFSSSIFDNCPSTLQVTQNPPPGEITEGGTVSLSALDASGNATAACEFEVVLVAEGAPTFTCPDPNEIPDLPVDADCNYDLPQDLNSLLKDFRNFKNSPLFENQIEQAGNTLQIQIRVYDGFQEEEFLVGECNFSIDLKDTTPPEAACVSSFTVQLDENGTASISAEDLDNGSSDSCGSVTRSLSQSSFTTADLANSPVEVTLTITDSAGNVDSCTVQVTVEPFEEELDPFSCITSLTLPLNGIGEAHLNVEQLYEGTLGPEGSVSVDKDFFTCEDIGEQTVYLTYSGTESGTCPVVITVVDKTPPAPRPKNIEIALDENGRASITAADLENGSTDNCSISRLQIQINKTSFTCEDVGENIIDFTVRDGNTNSTTTNVTVTVTDPHNLCGEDIPVEPPAEDRFVMLFPNPSRGMLQLVTSAGIELHRVEIFDMRGRFVDSRELRFNPLTQSYYLDLQMYQPGVYTLKLTSNIREYIRRAIITTY